MSKADHAPDLLLEGYELYEGPKKSEGGELVISSSVSLAETQLFHSDSHLGTGGFPTPLQNSTSKLPNSINLSDSETDSQTNMIDRAENMHQLSMSEMKTMKSLLEKLIGKTESNVIKNDKPKSVPANVRTERVQSPAPPSPAIIASTEEKIIKPLITNSSSSPNKNHSDHTYYDDTLPSTDDGGFSFSVNPEVTAQVTKATGKSIAQLKYKGHNIGGTILRPKSPTRNCSIPDKDKKHFPSALIEMNVKENTATALMRVQKHEVVCALGAPVLFRSHSGVFVSNIDMTYYWCNFCPFKTEEKKELTQHVITHRFHCRHCNYQSFSRADVIKHSSDVHLEFQETSVSLKYCALLPDYLQVSLIQSTGDDGEALDKNSNKLGDEFDSYVISYDGKNNADTNIAKLPVSDTVDPVENGEALIVHPPSSPKKSLLAEQPSTSKRKSAQTDLDSSKKSNPKKKHKSDNVDDNANDESDAEGSVSSSKRPKRSCVTKFSDELKKSLLESSSDSSSSDSDQEPLKNLMEIFECNSCEFKSKEMQKVREHMFRIHPGGKFYCIDKRIKKHKAKRYIFFCCKNKCPFQSTDPITYTQHVDRCTPLPVIAPNVTKSSKPTGLQMTVSFAKKCLKKLTKTEPTKKTGKKSKSEDDYGCHYCQFETDSLIAVKNHLNSGHAKNSFVVRDLKAVDSLMSFLYLCKYCAWYSRDYSKLKNHMDREHRIPDKKLMVSTNSAEAKKMSDENDKDKGKEKEKETDLLVVEESVAPTSSEDVSYRCYRCDFCTAGIETIKTHLTMAHPKCNLTAFSCKNGTLRTIQFCPQADCVFISAHSSEMERHKIISHNIPDPDNKDPKKVCYAQAYKCLSCNNTIATNLEDMKLHYLQQHPNETMMIRDCVAFDLQKPSQLYICDYSNCLFSDLDYKKFLFHNVAHEGGIVYECVHCNDWVSKERDDFNIHVASLTDMDHNLMESTVEMDRSGSITRRLGDVVVKFEEP